MRFMGGQLYRFEKTYSGFENQRRYGEAVNRGAVLRGGDCTSNIIATV